MSDYAKSLAMSLSYRPSPESLAYDDEYKKIWRFVNKVNFGMGIAGDLDKCERELRIANQGYKKVKQFQQVVKKLFPRGHPEREYKLRRWKDDMDIAARRLDNAKWMIKNSC